MNGKIFISVSLTISFFVALQNTEGQYVDEHERVARLTNGNSIRQPVSHTGFATETNNGSEPKKEKPNQISKHRVIQYDIYRDRIPYPVDPRKPCQICTQRQGGNSKIANRHARIYGFQGRPYKDIEPGGCLCGKKKQRIKHPNINSYWPTVTAGISEDFFPKKAAINAATFDRTRAIDLFDHLGGFEVSRYQRHDNGYCGRERDRYGCLGESKTLFSNVQGVGFREPGQPAPRGGVSFP